MDANRQHEIFRLSAILYADNNYEVSIPTIHKKIIESALLENNNQELTVAQAIVCINQSYGLLFSEAEIQNVIKAPKNEVFELRLQNGETYFRLTQKRVAVLKDKVSNNIGDFINEFEHLFGQDGSDIINRYIYELFQTNVTAFQHLLMRMIF